MLVWLSAASALACVWDYDTLKQEAARSPGTLELLAGKFNRHSPAFYEWRIEDRRVRLEAETGELTLTDDLAVAYDKVGRTVEGVALLREALAIDPDRYETHANLGTLLVHAGEYEAGLAHLRRAVVINPDAHFGRERWQIYLVEYVVANLGEDGQPRLPLGMVQHDGKPYHGWSRFREFLREKDLPEDWQQQAIRGVEGMMRFGRHDSPILNEALGDLLGGLPELDGQQRLAARAYLKAANHAPTPEAAAHYRAAAERALGSQMRSQVRRVEVDLASVEAAFALETTEGEAWFAQIAADEAAWIADGRDPEAMYDQKYQASPPELELSPAAAGYWWEQPSGLITLGLASVAPLAGLTYAWNRRRPRPA